jgi:pimeloyl-ACP methyl ester carboxylesterase
VLCAEIASILNKHGYSRVVLATHSYGSVIATHLLAQAETAPMIADIVLIDPVTILLHLPDVAYNFTRRPPQSASEHQLWYFASMDMGVAHSLARHFFWSENVLWKEALEGRDVTVSLAGRDLIVNTEAVGRYLAEGDEQTDDEEDVETRPDASEDGGLLAEDAWKRRSWRGKGIDILWFDDLDHAQVFDTPATRRPVLEALRAYSANGGVVAGEPADSD